MRPRRFADLVDAAARAEAVRPAPRRFPVEVEARQRDGVARGEERRLPADRADLALDVVERQVAFGGGVELEDLGQAETLGEGAPHVGGKPIAAGEAQPMRLLRRRRRRGDEIAAELADVLKDRAVPARDLAPETASRELVGDHHRAAIDQRRGQRGDAADAVAQRQAIVHAVVGAHVGQSREPMAPGDDAMVADGGGLGQAGGAGGEDQQRAVGEGRPAPFALVKRRAAECREREIDAARVVGAAVGPEVERQAGESVGASFGERRFDDRRPRAGDPDAMGERGAGEVDVQQRDDDADLGQSEPQRKILGPGAHHQRDHVAFGEPGGERPARIKVGALGERAEAELFDIAEHGRRVAVGGGPVAGGARQGAGGIARRLGGRLQRLEPGAGGRRGARPRRGRGHSSVS